MDNTDVKEIEADITKALNNIKLREAGRSADNILYTIKEYALMRGHKIKNVEVKIDMHIDFAFEMDG